MPQVSRCGLVNTTLLLVPLFFALVACGQDGDTAGDAVSGAAKSLSNAFLGKKECDTDSSFDCNCVVLNSPEHQKRTKVTVLKCPGDENYEAAQGHEYCLNRDPATGELVERLSVDGCPWVKSEEEAAELRVSE